MNHISLDRAGPDDRDFDDQVVEFIRAQTRKHGHLGAGFDLEDADGVGIADHGVNGGVFGGDGVKGEGGRKRRRDGETKRRSAGGKR